MGAVFRDKKKTKILQWNKYSILYTWKKYNVSKTSTNVETRTLVSSFSIPSNELYETTAIGYTYYRDDSSSSYKYSVRSGTESDPNCRFIIDHWTIRLQNLVSNAEDTNCQTDMINTKYAINSNGGYSSTTMYEMIGNGTYTGFIIKAVTSDYGNHVVVPVDGGKMYRVTATTKFTYSHGLYIGTVSSNNMSAYPLYGVSSDNYWYTYSGTSKGSLIETVSAKEGTYPDNGIQDGYWYVKV